MNTPLTPYKTCSIHTGTCESTSKHKAMMGPSLSNGASVEGKVRRQPWLMDCEIR
jgi:hypothetical protein